MSRTLLALLLMTGCSEYGLGFTPPAEDADDTAEPNVGIPDGIPTGGITGRICAPDQETWVVGARVYVEHEWGVTETLTGQDGWFVLEKLPLGEQVVHVEKGKFGVQVQVEVFEGEITELPNYECLQQGDVKIAVVTGDYDAIGEMISDLNLTFDSINGRTSDEYIHFLRDEDWLAEYDLIFFNCGMGFDWTLHQEEVVGNLRDYVSAGGSVYASDWAYFLVEAAWPGKQTFYGDDAALGDAFVGEAGSVNAKVLDPAMIALLGSETASINFDLGAWAAATEAKGEVLIEGQYAYYDYDTFQSGTQYGPLAFRMTDNGSVTYTSFHNEQQTTVDMIHILQEIILAL